MSEEQKANDEPAAKRSRKDEEGEQDVSLLARRALNIVAGQWATQSLASIEAREAELRKSESLLADAREAAPALFAKKGDRFTHQNQRDYFPAEFEFVRRTTDNENKSKCKKGSCPEVKSKKCPDCGHGPEKGWLVFRFLYGDGFHGYSGLNGGMRDVCGAWPCVKYQIYDENGEEQDENLICLPPSKCYGFRPSEDECYGDY